MFKKSSRQFGFTMIELLITISIVATLALAFLLLSRTQMNRARDADRKADLQKIKTVFEEYYNDNNCYPPPTILDACGGTALEPYLDAIPCDPSTNEPYLYLPISGNQCKGYRLFAQLLDVNDPNIQQIGCDGPDECGVFPGYNYGVSAGVALIPEGSGGGGGGGGGGEESTTMNGPWACAPGAPSNCNNYGLQAAIDAGCPYSFVEDNCQSRCSNPAFVCPQ